MQTIGSRDFAAELKGHPGYILTWAPFHGQTLWYVDDKRAVEIGFWSEEVTKEEVAERIAEWERKAKTSKGSLGEPLTGTVGGWPYPLKIEGSIVADVEIIRGWDINPTFLGSDVVFEEDGDFDDWMGLPLMVRGW